MKKKLDEIKIVILKLQRKGNLLSGLFEIIIK